MDGKSWHDHLKKFNCFSKNGGHAAIFFLQAILPRFATSFSKLPTLNVRLICFRSDFKYGFCNSFVEMCLGGVFDILPVLTFLIGHVENERNITVLCIIVLPKG